MALAAGLGVAQLLGYVGGLIWKIKRAADTAEQNKRECDTLARYVSNIDERLRSLPMDPELAQPLAQLGSTLKDADELVAACQERGALKQFFRGRAYADRFREVNTRITNDLTLFPFAFYTANRRLDGVIIPAQPDNGVPTPATAITTGSDDHPREFTWAEIKAATGILAFEFGGGRSGTVYKGRLQQGGRVREVAVKVLKKHARLGMEVAFVAEREILSRLCHDHIARLVGWCSAEERRMFVYEYMSNGTLRDHLLGLRGGGVSPVASSWKARLEVLLGAARGIEHLHNRATPPVIHRNVSSSNILLDASWTSRLSDFGQALWQEAGKHGVQGQLVPEVISTFGYLDPEYDSTSRVSPASDVYSFGVVMLEVLTGRPHHSSSKGNSSGFPVTLVSSVLPVIQNGKLWNVLDGRPMPTPRQLEALELVARTAERCLRPQGKDRPTMTNVVANLERALRII